MNELNLTPQDFLAISPLLALVGTALLILLSESFLGRSAKIISPILTLAGLGLALLFTVVAPVSTHPLLTNWLNFDSTNQLFTLLFLSIGLATVMLAFSFFKEQKESHGEFYFLLVAAIFGLILVGQSADFLTLFLGIETLSLSLYVLCSYQKKKEISQEAAIKYFLLGSLSSAFLLFGIALLYGALGTTQFANLLPAYQSLEPGTSMNLFLTGIALIILGFAFKAAVVPFHVWAPDVYEGAPTPVTAFMAVGTKAGAFAAFIRVVIEALPELHSLWHDLVACLAIPTLIYANWVALKQTHFRRFFAYSGISHAGFLLIGVAAGTTEALNAILFYLVIYTLATLAAFAIAASLEKQYEGIKLNDLKGLFRHSPLLAGIMALALLTLAGIPPTAGFFAKLYLFKVAFAQGYIAVVLVALATTLLAAFYYTRIVAMMFMEPTHGELPTKQLWPAAALGFLCFLLIIFISFYPSPVFSILQ